MSSLIVRRGLSTEYYRFLSLTTNTNGDELVVDRRLTERRRGADASDEDRRLSDRRGPPPATWERDDLIVIPHA